MIRFYPRFAVVIFSMLCSLAHGQSGDAREFDQVREFLLEEETHLKPDDLRDLITTDRYESGHNQVTHLYLSQTHEGVRIVNSTLTAAFDAAGNLVGGFSRFLPTSTYESESPNPAISAVDAAKTQVARDIPAGLNVSTEVGEDAALLFTGDGFQHRSKVELVYFAEPEGLLRLAWEFDLDYPDGSHWHHYLVSAHSGEILQKNDWMVSCAPFATEAGHFDSPPAKPLPSAELLTPFDGSGYRVFPLPVESPNHGNRVLLEEPADPVASPFGWHDTDGQEGAEYTITRGNNTHAYEDEADENEPGYSPDGGAGLNFDFDYDPGAFPESYQSAAVVNLFYATNRIHDILYHFGFDEAGGNFQQTNYSGAGLGGDYLRAEAQDGGGMNNANMATPSDGNRPRMQMYLWAASDENNEGLTVHDPSPLAGAYPISTPATFGPDIPEAGITANLAMALDGTGDVLDLCSPLVNAPEIEGNIAIVRRGSCNFVDKVQRAQDAGALAVIVVNNVPGSVIAMGGASPSINIPSVMVTQSLGEGLISALEDGQTLVVSLSRPGGESIKDGSFDNGIVIHEYVHGLSNRLTGGPSNSSCLQNEEQPGEGWSDWFAIMLTMNMEVSNPVYRPMGTFAAGQSVEGTGIRPVAYDTSFAVNDYTYADISSSALSVPHGIGFVWATMLWDLTWAFVDTYGYDPDFVNGSAGNNMVMQLVTDGMKFQPCNPGFVDARDAILLADELLYGGSNQCMIWKVFAKRGLGFGADQGSSESVNDGTAAFDVPVACLDATLPPIADFQVFQSQTCTGLVHFEDLSTQTPQAWQWDFGDGHTSDLQNPSHQYDAPGMYSVSLTVSNTLGEDISTQTDLIAYEPPNQPLAESVEGCAGEETQLTATAVGEGQIRWRNAAMEILEVGPSLNVTVGESDSIYFAEQVVGDLATVHVGPEDGSIGSGSIHQNAFVGTVDFEAHQPLTILSAWVNNFVPGTRTVNLWNAAGGAGVIVQSASVEFNFTGWGRVDLNIVIDQPGVYSMGMNMAGLYRNDGGVNYPYDVPGMMTITGSSAGPDHYYYFYDLELQKQVCVGEAVEVLVENTGNALFDYEHDNLTVTFSPLSSETVSLNWDFGDGNTAPEQSPTHTYETPGTYTVVHTTVDDCVSEMEIEVGTVDVEDATAAGFQIFPNPASDRVNIAFPHALIGEDVEIEMRSVSGAVVLRKHLRVESVYDLRLKSPAPGVYFLVIATDEMRVQERIVIL